MKRGEGVRKAVLLFSPLFLFPPEMDDAEDVRGASPYFWPLSFFIEG